GEPLFVVMQTNPVRVFVDTSEEDGGFVRDRDAATIRIQALKGREFAGKVTRSTWAFDARAHTLRAEIDLENPDDILHHGMYAFAKITVKRSDVWTLPATAVAMQGEQPFCFRVENGKAIKTPLQVGLAGTETVEVVKKKVGDVWQEVTGAESILANAAGVSDGQVIEGP